jgi:hypothetical protein
MRLTTFHIVAFTLAAIAVGYFFGRQSAPAAPKGKEGFLGFELGGGGMPGPRCDRCGGNWPCGGCAGPKGPSRPMCPPCPPCREPDLSKYVLKASGPPCPAMPDMSQYMLKSECPPTPDLSKYVLKSSIPKPQPIIVDNSACREKGGECPPCPRPRCPEVKCPAPTKCAPPAPCPRPVCPPQVVKCRAEQSYEDRVRPFLAPLGMPSFGSVM